ncbi:hypothetical protein [Paractinoplanes lichenicola]|uniref:Uncharacterized protein n=1 Tax=Paractinoplanes lichenicola TaxID=2802976 RepID=A0ABS1VLY3_9ACTN|nr:hypothetical protein [Actinoplanes lichenicola]MBL7255613.1 hypothetical protein [Actinoplanes lichenicola]
MGRSWEERMAARAYARAGENSERRRRPLLPDRPGHVGHHLHRTAAGSACSCGEDFQEACVVDPGEDAAWWGSQRCVVCDRPGTVLEGDRPAT